MPEDRAADTGTHWSTVYSSKPLTTVSWYQTDAVHSLELIRKHHPDHGARIIDIGAGASPLVDGLLNAGYADLTILDIAAPALELTRARLGPRADAVTFVVADLLTATLPHARYDIWHDRAVFHFLTTAEDRARYRAQLRHALAPHGLVILATFAEDGPERCSGLTVARYSGDALAAELGDGFITRSITRELHLTPSGATQAFTYLLAERTGD